MVLLPSKKSATLHRMEEQTETSGRSFDLPIPLTTMDTQRHTNISQTVPFKLGSYCYEFMDFKFFFLTKER